MRIGGPLNLIQNSPFDELMPPKRIASGTAPASQTSASIASAFARSWRVAYSGVGSSGGGTNFRRGARSNPCDPRSASGTSFGSIRTPVLATTYAAYRLAEPSDHASRTFRGVLVALKGETRKDDAGAN